MLYNRHLVVEEWRVTGCIGSKTCGISHEIITLRTGIRIQTHFMEISLYTLVSFLSVKSICYMKELIDIYVRASLFDPYLPLALHIFKMKDRKE
jgi:hypothetical protein